MKSAASNAPKAVVIGSGFGGLAAAIRLAARGYRVTVLEKLAEPGGRASVFRQDGFVFDAGPTIITAPFLLEELWGLCGRRMAEDIDLRPMDPFYRIRFADGTHFDYRGDADAMRAEIARLAPGDVAGYDRFMREADLCYRLGFEKLGMRSFNTFGDLVRAVPSLARMRGWSTIHSLVARHFRDPRLRVVFSFHPLLIGGNPFSVTRVYSLINTLERRYGVHFAMGGTGALVRGLVGLIAGQGSTIRCNAEVERIEVENGVAKAVRLRGGERIAADIVVSNADTAWTYRNLIAPEHRRHWTDRRVDRGAYSMSLFVWYFGTRRRYDEVPHHMLVLGPRYRELLQDIFHAKRLADDFSLYLHRPTATDPALAPPGCDTFYALSPVPHLGSGTDWRQAAEPYRERIADALERSVLPGLRGQIVTSRVMTPLDFRDRLLSFQGAAFGLEPRLTQSAWFRPHNASEDVRNLFLVGAGTHPGAGIPGVLCSARALDEVVPHATLAV